MEAKRVLGIDCGGTFIKAGLISDQGEILDQTALPTDPGQGREGVLFTFEKLIGKYKNQIEAVGIGFAAPLDWEAGIILEPVNFPKEWHNFPLVKTLQQRVARPVYLQNDAKVAALGEYWQGAGQGSEVLVVMTLGTGIGGGIIIHGNLWLGATKIAGEVGHITIASDGPVCGCGQRGCLETYASCTAIVRIAKELAQSSQQPTLLANEPNLTADKVYQIAKKGDAVAKSLFVQAGQSLAKGIVNICRTLGPQRIVLTGGGAGAWDLLYPPLEEAFAKIAFKNERSVQIVRGVLGDKSGMLGAAYFVFQRLPKTG